MQVTTYRLCPQCNGTGEYLTSGGVDGQVVPCPWPGCNQTGYVVLGMTEFDPGLDDILDRVNDVLDKCNDILEEVRGE